MPITEPNTPEHEFDVWWKTVGEARTRKQANAMLWPDRDKAEDAVRFVIHALRKVFVSGVRLAVKTVTDFEKMRTTITKNHCLSLIALHEAHNMPLDEGLAVIDPDQNPAVIVEKTDFYNYVMKLLDREINEERLTATAVDRWKLFYLGISPKDPLPPISPVKSTIEKGKVNKFLWKNFAARRFSIKPITPTWIVGRSYFIRAVDSDTEKVVLIKSPVSTIRATTLAWFVALMFRCSGKLRSYIAALADEDDTIHNRAEIISSVLNEMTARSDWLEADFAKISEYLTVIEKIKELDSTVDSLLNAAQDEEANRTFAVAIKLRTNIVTSLVENHAQ